MDRQRIEAFLDSFVRQVSGATTVGLLSIADRSGLLAWLGEHESGTVEDIARAAEFDARYVREIMSGLAAAGVVEYREDDEVFILPEEHAIFLTGGDSPYFMGGWLDMVPAILAQVDALAHATKHGGGVGFEDFGNGLIRGIDRGNAPSQRVFLTTRWLPAIPGLVDKLENGAHIADVGCGSGTAAITMARSYPRSRVLGFDVSPESLAIAQSRSAGIANLSFGEYSVEAIPLEPPYDLVTAFDVIHDLSDPLAGLERIRESLTDGGGFLMMEPNLSSNLEENLDPLGALFYGVSTMFCMTQSLARGGEGLGAAWGREKAADYARDAGFTSFQAIESIENRFSAFYLLTV